MKKNMQIVAKVFTSATTYSIISIIIAIVVLYKSTQQFSMQFEAQQLHNKLSLQPLLDFRFAYLYNDAEFYLINVGEGTAEITKIEYWYDHIKYPNINSFIAHIDSSVGFYGNDKDSTTIVQSSLSNDNTYLAKGEKLPIIGLQRVSFERALKMYKIIHSTGVVVTYLTPYDDTLTRQINLSEIKKNLGS